MLIIYLIKEFKFVFILANLYIFILANNLNSYLFEKIYIFWIVLIIMVQTILTALTFNVKASF